ncbi:MAG: carboxymuconolactone decarboxylase family protein [Myxococcota bacterium]
MTARPRLEPRPAEHAQGSGPAHMLGTLAHQPALVEPFLGFAAALALKGVLPRRDSELLALRTAWNCGSEYEWGHHELYARDAGLDAPAIVALTQAPAAYPWSTRDRALVEAADALHAHQEIPARLWETLQRELTAGECVELSLVVGQYTMLSMLANAVAMTLEAGVPGWPEGRRPTTG